MTKDEGFKLVKIQTCVLRVNIHCDGCKQKVKKLLQRIEGVCQVTIDAELQKVTVLGGVDAATLIRKLFRAGKHAELWIHKFPQNQKQKDNCIKNDNKNMGQKQQGNQMKGLEALNNQQQFPFISEEGDGYYLMNDDGEVNVDELLFNQLNFLRQQQAIQVNNGGGNKKGNHQNQNVCMNGGNLEAMDQRTLAALRMSNPPLNGGENMNHGDQRMAVNDINSMMNLAGFHANGSNGVYQMQPNNGFMGSSSTHHRFPNAGHHHNASMTYGGGGYPQQQQQFNYPSSVLMNLQNRQTMQQQPQMMYNRSPFIPTTTGYFHNNSLSPYASYHGDHSSATHVSSDDNTSSCSII